MSNARCPQCGTVDGIENVEDMCRAFGVPNNVGKQWMCTNCSDFFDGDAECWYADADFSEYTISQLSDVIFDDWGDSISLYAYPYAEAMADIETLDDMYGLDSAPLVVANFLSAAEEWNSDVGHTVRNELQRRLDAHFNTSN
jgi:hypothetical protein